MNASPSKAMPTILKLMVTITIYFLRQKMKKEVYYYACEWKLKCYKGKDGDVQYTRK